MFAVSRLHRLAPVAAIARRVVNVSPSARLLAPFNRRMSVAVGTGGSAPLSKPRSMFNSSPNTTGAAAASAAAKNAAASAAAAPSSSASVDDGSRGMSASTILGLPSSPAIAPSYPRGPYTFYNREYLIIAYESDPAYIRAVVPEPLIPNKENTVLYEWIAMPDSTGFGSYKESGTVIPCTLNGEEVNFTVQMFLNCEPPIAAGREIWGFPKKFGDPAQGVMRDTAFGTLHYGGQEVATGTMTYKYKEIPEAVALKSLTKTSVNLKVIPDVDFKNGPKICQLVGYNLTNVKLKGAWEGPARLHLTKHINAPAADLPIRRVIGGRHFLADITLPYGRVLYDYNKEHGRSKPSTGSGSGAAPSTHMADPPIPFTLERVRQSHAMPVISPSYASGPLDLFNREMFVVKYRTSRDALRRALPDVLEPNSDDFILLEWAQTHSAGAGAYSKVDMRIPCTHVETGETYNFGVQSYVNSSSSITLGREVFGQPSKYGVAAINVHRDTLTGSLIYSGLPVAQATTPFKHHELPIREAVAHLQTPELNLKLIPDCKGEPAIAQLVALQHQDIHVQSAFAGPARLALQAHVNAPIADFPVREVATSYHMLCDFRLIGGQVIHNYLKPNKK